MLRVAGDLEREQSAAPAPSSSSSSSAGVAVSSPSELEASLSLSSTTDSAASEPSFSRPMFVDPLTDENMGRYRVRTRSRAGSFQVFHSSEDIRRLIRQTTPEKPLPALASSTSYQILRTVFYSSSEEHQ